MRYDEVRDLWSENRCVNVLHTKIKFPLDVIAQMSNEELEIYVESRHKREGVPKRQDLLLAYAILKVEDAESGFEMNEAYRLINMSDKDMWRQLITHRLDVQCEDLRDEFMREVLRYLLHSAHINILDVILDSNDATKRIFDQIDKQQLVVGMIDCFAPMRTMQRMYDLYRDDFMRAVHTGIPLGLSHALLIARNGQQFHQHIDNVSTYRNMNSEDVNTLIQHATHSKFISRSVFKKIRVSSEDRERLRQYVNNDV